MIIIKHPQGDVSIQELQNDVNKARDIYGNNQYAFTPMTVQALIDKIIELNNTLAIKQ
jgi:hypothetical protein